MKQLFKYALKVWVLAIVLMFVIGLGYLKPINRHNWDIIPLMFLLSFYFSIPALLAYWLGAYYINKLNLKQWLKKLILAFGLVLLMAILAIVVDGEKTFYRPLLDKDTQAMLIASFTAVLMVKLPLPLLQPKI